MAHKVMLVEDHAATREALTRVLLRNGYDVMTADHGQQAFDLLTSLPLPDVVLLDMLMPVLDGWHLLERIKGTRAAKTPIIITTGTILTRDWAVMQGCAGFVKKPVDEQDMLDELRSVLRPAA
jgi:CheY-like chemotaxis protein